MNCLVHPFCSIPGLLSVSALGSLCLHLSLRLPPPLTSSVSLSISFSLTSVKCNWRSSHHMAHRQGGDIVCAVAANCYPCSSEPIPLLHFFLPSLFILCPSSHYFISQSSLSPLSTLFPPHSICLTQLFHFLLQVMFFNRFKMQVFVGF